MKSTAKTNDEKHRLQHVLSNNRQTYWAINKLVLTKFPITLYKFQTKLFLTLLNVGISSQISINMASKVSIKKYNDVDLPIDTLNDIYRLKTGTRKENHYLVIPKDCNIYVQMHENERISFKTTRKIKIPKMFLRGPAPIHLRSVVAYCKNLGQCQIFLAQSIAASLIGLGHMQGMSAMRM